MVALGCAATYWMLLPLMSPRWSFLGGVLAATHPEIFNLGQGYWTGGVGLLGGALVGGIAARIIAWPRRITSWHGVILGVGSSLLAYHRPFEGLVTLLLTTVGATAVRPRNAGDFAGAGKLALPALAVSIPAAGWLGYYNWRLTGSATELPQLLYDKQYTVVPAFYWMPVNRIPVYRNEELREVPG